MSSHGSQRDPSTAHNSTKIAENFTTNICDQRPPEEMDENLKGVQWDPLLILLKIVRLCWVFVNDTEDLSETSSGDEGPAPKAKNRRRQGEPPAWKLARQGEKLANKSETLHGRKVHYFFLVTAINYFQDSK